MLHGIPNLNLTCTYPILHPTKIITKLFVNNLLDCFWCYGFTGVVDHSHWACVFCFRKHIRSKIFRIDRWCLPSSQHRESWKFCLNIINHNSFKVILKCFSAILEYFALFNGCGLQYNININNQNFETWILVIRQWR